jgi:predicted HicB family RNase H-like nuclease
MQLQHGPFTGFAHRKDTGGWFVRLHGYNLNGHVEELNEEDIQETVKRIQKTFNELTETAVRDNIPSERTVSGKFLVRTSPATHQAAREAAAAANMSLTQWLAQIIEIAAQYTDLSEHTPPASRNVINVQGRPRKKA